MGLDKITRERSKDTEEEEAGIMTLILSRGRGAGEETSCVTEGAEGNGTETKNRDFPDGPGVEISPSNTESAGFRELRSHMPLGQKTKT